MVEKGDKIKYRELRDGPMSVYEGEIKEGEVKEVIGNIVIIKYEWEGMEVEKTIGKGQII